MRGTLGRGVGRRTAAETERDATDMGEKDSGATAGVAEVVGAADAGGHARRGEGAVDVAGAVGGAAEAGEVGGAWMGCGLQRSARTPAPAAERSQGGAAQSFDGLGEREQGAALTEEAKGHSDGALMAIMLTRAVAKARG